MIATRLAPLDDPAATRRAGRELLSLLLMDARNRLLALLVEDEAADALRLAVRAGWFQERWIGCHVQRRRGEACDAAAPRLAGVEPRAAGWLRDDDPPPAADAVRGYLAQTLEISLDLLAALPASADDGDAGDAALHVYRLSLLHEDRLVERLAERLLLGAPPARPERAPLWLPAQRWLLGSTPGGLVPHNERWAHPVAVPEFEIDAQPVSWARYAEFAEDGGYDRRECWTDAGWRWVQAEGRRAPRHVEQLQRSVLVQRRGGLQRAPGAQAAMHLSRFEAEAWCRWAGRRLPTEPEWELAASAGAGRGFVWGDVLEWVGGSARCWPGAGDPAPGWDELPGAVAAPNPGVVQGVLRGASVATPRRWHHAKARRFAAPDTDHAFCGFRSCSP